MVKILHVVNSMNRGGLESFIMNVYRNIDRKKIQFDFLVHSKKQGDYDNEIRKLGGKIRYIPPRNNGLIRNRKALNNFFKSNNTYKIIHLHSSSLSYIEPLIYAKKYGSTKRIIHSHSTKEGGSKLHNVLHYLNRFRIKKIATDFLSCSDLAKKWFYGNFQGCDLIKNGIDVNRFKFELKTRDKIRKDLKINDRFVLGNVGNFTYPKNHEFLIDIFFSFLKKNPKALLMLVGSGELIDGIKKKVEILGIRSNVMFMGSRPDVNILLQAFDVFIMPSHFEGLPVSLVEAQASGLPCFVSDKITKDIGITKNIDYLSLEENADKWCEKIFENTINFTRKDMSKVVTNKGFNINSTIAILEKLYLNEKRENESK